ncbi:MAG: hypothetical protein R3D68_14765 [Hyphomicrobiaceae bacterium]
MRSASPFRRFFSRLALPLAVVAGTPASIPAQALAQELRVGFQLVTRADDAGLAEGTAILFYRGPIAYPIAENLREITHSLPAAVTTVLLDLDSDGGELDDTERVIAVLKDLRGRLRLETRVRHGAHCLSACVPIFMQGVRRSAGGASVWMLHGACVAHTNVPGTAATYRYVQMLRDAGIAESFLCDLARKGVFREPGRYWLSGHELFAHANAGVITDLIPAWQPENPQTPPFDPNIRAR